MEIDFQTVNNTPILKVRNQRGYKTWVAKISHPHGRYVFGRHFLPFINNSFPSCERNTSYYQLEHGEIYEVCESGDRKGFIRVNPDSSEGYDKLSTEEVSDLINENQ